MAGVIPNQEQSVHFQLFWSTKGASLFTNDDSQKIFSSVNKFFSSFSFFFICTFLVDGDRQTVQLTTGN
jgi:hypothetical protein